MINILYFIPSLTTSGGMERVLVEKANYLIATGIYHVVIVTTEMRANDTVFFHLNGDIEVICLELNYNDLFSKNFLDKIKEIQKLNNRYRKSIQNIIKKYSIDICITMGGKELEFLGDLDLPCKKIYESHFNKHFRSSFLKANGKTGLFWKIIGKIRDIQHDLQARKLDKIVVLTQVNLNAWGGASNLVKLIPNPSPIINKTKKIPNLNSKRVVAIGKLDVQKGYDMLITAWSKISNQHTDWKLDIFGHGELKNQLQLQIEDLGLSSSIFLRGLTKMVEKELYDSSFFVMSSRFEGLPMVLIESITCGLPIVSFDCETGPSEIIVDNDCGLLVKNGDVDKLAESIEKMILNEGLRYEMAKSALKKSDDYKIGNIMKKWEVLFQELVGSS